MGQDAEQYLKVYRNHLDSDLYRGPAGWLRARLDARARRQGQLDRHGLFLPRVLSLCGLKLNQPLRVLEIGCGSGWALSFKHPKVTYVAVDRGAEFKAELEGRGITFHQVDITQRSVPEPDGSVDLLILSHLIEHVSDTSTLLTEVRRLLKPGGVLYVRTPDVERVGWRFYDDYTHVRPFTRGGLDQLMKSAGFDRIYSLYSDHPRIILDTLTNGRIRHVILGKVMGGNEIESAYVTNEQRIC